MEQPNIIVSLWSGPVNHIEHYQGCGVCINDEWLLTAGHVANNLTTNGKCFAGNIQNRDNGYSIAEIKHHPKRDLAVLRLAAKHGKDIAMCDVESELAKEREIFLLAYNKTERCLRGPESAGVLNWAEPGSFDTDKLPVPGMSGGAVLLRNKLVGIIQAKDEHENSGIVIPLAAAKDFLAPYLPKKSAVNEHRGRPSMGVVEFKATIRNKIVIELKNVKVQTLLAGLRWELAINATDTEEVSFQVADKLLKMDVDEAIRNYLMPVAVACLQGSADGDLPKSGSDVIRKAAKEILGWLVLSFVDEDRVARLMRAGLNDDSLYFVLGQNTLGGVEVVVSRSFEHKAELTLQKDHQGKRVLRGQNYIHFDPRLFNEDDEEVVRKLELEIWNTVFDDPGSQKKSHEKLTGIDQPNSEIGILNATLRNRRKMKVSTKHYYIAFTLNELPKARADIIYRKLLAGDSLREMTVVEFGTTEGSETLVLNEYDVIAAINDFYQEVNKQDQMPIG